MFSPQQDQDQEQVDRKKRSRKMRRMGMTDEEQYSVLSWIGIRISMTDTPPVAYTGCRRKRKMRRKKRRMGMTDEEQYSVLSWSVPVWSR